MAKNTEVKSYTTKKGKRVRSFLRKNKGKIAASALGLGVAGLLGVKYLKDKKIKDELAQKEMERREVKKLWKQRNNRYNVEDRLDMIGKNFPVDPDVLEAVKRQGSTIDPYHDVSSRFLQREYETLNKLMVDKSRKDYIPQIKKKKERLKNTIKKRAEEIRATGAKLKYGTDFSSSLLGTSMEFKKESKVKSYITKKGKKVRSFVRRNKEALLGTGLGLALAGAIYVPKYFKSKKEHKETLEKIENMGSSAIPKKPIKVDIPPPVIDPIKQQELSNKVKEAYLKDQHQAWVKYRETIPIEKRRRKNKERVASRLDLLSREFEFRPLPTKERRSGEDIKEAYRDKNEALTNPVKYYTISPNASVIPKGFVKEKKGEKEKIRKEVLAATNRLRSKKATLSDGSYFSSSLSENIMKFEKEQVKSYTTKKGKKVRSFLRRNKGKIATGALGLGVAGLLGAKYLKDKKLQKLNLEKEERYKSPNRQKNTQRVLERLDLIGNQMGKEEDSFFPVTGEMLQQGIQDQNLMITDPKKYVNLAYTFFPEGSRRATIKGLIDDKPKLKIARNQLKSSIKSYSKKLRDRETKLTDGSYFSSSLLGTYEFSRRKKPLTTEHKRKISEAKRKGYLRRVGEGIANATLTGAAGRIILNASMGGFNGLSLKEKLKKGAELGLTGAKQGFVFGTPVTIAQEGLNEAFYHTKNRLNKELEKRGFIK